MTVFNAEEVKKCLEDVVGEDKEYALWLLEWAINKRSFDLEEYRKQIRAEVIEELLKQVRKEEKWLFKVIGSNQNINIAFGGIYAKAEQLKEQSNET